MPARFHTACVSQISRITQMALFHCMVRYGSVWFTFVFFSTGYSTWYFLVPPRPRFQAIRTVTKTWRVNSTDHWLAWENRQYCVNWTCDTRPNIDLLDLNQHSQRSIATFVWTNANFCINQKIAVSWSVEEVQTFLSLIAEERIQRELNEKALCIYFLHFVYFRVYFLFIVLPLYLCFASIKNNLIE